MAHRVVLLLAYVLFCLLFAQRAQAVR